MTIKDIAKKAGVSVATVSHVINKTRFVSEELQKRVLKVMADADYKPNLIASSLRSKKTKTMGLIMPDISNPVYAELAKEIESILFTSGFTLMLCNSEHSLNREIEYISSLRAKRVDGLIIIPASSEIKHINRLVKIGLPIVVLDRPVPGSNADAVYIDHYQGVFDATSYLIELGHRRIAYIDKQPLDLPHKSARLKGFYKALELNNIEADRKFYVEGGVSFEDGARAMKFLLKRDPMPTAVLSFDDVVAMGALRTIKDNGFRVPEDISVIGFDDMPLCSYTVPRLTTIYYPISEMAEMACKLLLNRIEGSETDQKNVVVLPVRLVLRESTSEYKNS